MTTDHGVTDDPAEASHTVEQVWRSLGVRVEPAPDALPIAGDCLFVLPGGAVRGLAAARPYFAAYVGAYPDTVKHVQNVVHDGPISVIRSVVTGTNTGTLVTPGSTAPPSGLEVAWDVVERLVVDDGEIVEWRIYQDATPYIDTINSLRLQMQRAAGLQLDQAACAAEAMPVQRFDSPLVRTGEAATKKS